MMNEENGRSNEEVIVTEAQTTETEQEPVINHKFKNFLFCTGCILVSLMIMSLFIKFANHQLDDVNDDLNSLDAQLAELSNSNTLTLKTGNHSQLGVDSVLKSIWYNEDYDLELYIYKDLDDTYKVTLYDYAEKGEVFPSGLEDGSLYWTEIEEYDGEFWYRLEINLGQYYIDIYPIDDGNLRMTFIDCLGKKYIPYKDIHMTRQFNMGYLDKYEN